MSPSMGFRLEFGDALKCSGFVCECTTHLGRRGDEFPSLLEHEKKDKVRGFGMCHEESHL